MLNNQNIAAGETNTNAIDIETVTAGDLPITDDFISFTDWFAEEDTVDDVAMELLRIGQEPKFLQMFTMQAVKVEVHYLDPDDVLSNGGYCHCLGEDCPACKATVAKKKFMLMPVGDLIHGDIKILRIPLEKGPGKMATELEKVFALSDPSAVTTMISRARNFKHTVITKAAGEYHADIAEAVKRFLKNIDDGVITLNDAIATLSAEDMAAHSEIAKKLKLTGNA